MTEQDSRDFEQVISRIETKLANLEEKRDAIADEIRIQEAQIEELTNTLSKLRQLENRLSENSSPEEAD